MECPGCRHPEAEAVGSDHLGLTVWACLGCGRLYRGAGDEPEAWDEQALGEDAWED